MEVEVVLVVEVVMEREVLVVMVIMVKKVV